MTDAVRTSRGPGPGWSRPRPLFELVPAAQALARYCARQPGRHDSARQRYRRCQRGARPRRRATSRPSRWPIRCRRLRRAGIDRRRLLSLLEGPGVHDWFGDQGSRRAARSPDATSAAGTLRLLEISNSEHPRWPFRAGHASARLAAPSSSTAPAGASVGAPQRRSMIASPTAVDGPAAIPTGGAHRATVPAPALASCSATRAL
jgi:hypothetical protein